MLLPWLQLMIRRFSSAAADLARLEAMEKTEEVGYLGRCGEDVGNSWDFFVSFTIYLEWMSLIIKQHLFAPFFWLLCLSERNYTVKLLIKCHPP